MVSAELVTHCQLVVWQNATFDDVDDDDEHGTWIHCPLEIARKHSGVTGAALADADNDDDAAMVVDRTKPVDSEDVGKDVDSTDEGGFIIVTAAVVVSA